MKLFSKPLWGVLSGVTLVLTVGSIIGSNYAMTEGSAAINMAFQTSNFITVNDPDAKPTIFYASDYENMVGDLKYSKETAQALFEEDSAMIEKAELEGAVLLWNNNKTLPLKGNENVSLLSHSSVDLVECGSGSGYVTTVSMSGEDASVTMKEAFNDRGFKVNNTLWDFYSTGAGKSYKRTSPEGQCTEWRRWDVNEVPWSVYTTAVKDSFAQYGDVAFIVLSRTGGEYSDLHFNYANANDFKGENDQGKRENTSAQGGYLGLTDQEDDLFKNTIKYKNDGTFSKVVVLLNTPNPIQFQDLEGYYDDIDACMWIGQPGSTGINSVADLLKGETPEGVKVSPSGRLSDTFAYDNNSAPATENDGNYRYAGDLSKLQQNDNKYNTYMVYQEGIYVGYRYYETRYADYVEGNGNADSTKGAKHSSSGWYYDEEVAFPFGYGDSYTSFEYSNYKVAKIGNDYKISVDVKNTGDYPSKEVVQAYISKPYTNYDKNNDIEKSAVELAGYNKTRTLKAGESQNIEIVIPYESFKSYDANGAETYIVEEGDYYITIGSDAHNANNNILQAKGKNSVTYSLFGDYQKKNKTNLNGTFAYKASLKKDFTTFSKSEVTGEEIHNQFDEGDINKYTNAGVNQVTYLSRSDWDETYPSTPTLTMNANMALDLRNDIVPDDEGVDMPTYSTFASGSTTGTPNVDAGDLVAYQFMDAPLYPEYAKDKSTVYDDGLGYVDHWNKMWNQLLDQMTFDEQALMAANAYHQLNGATSVNLPASKQENGPVGITKRGDFPVPDTKIKNYKYVSYPCAGILAASFDDSIAEDVGNHKSEDMLFLGYNGIYGPGVNMHRTPFGGRAFEYPSEDPYLAGRAEYYESKGIESKGCLAYAKHYALNDTETNRRHVGIWSNEQATREIYLRAFELTFREGGASATMNSFTRVGTKWNGGCVEMMTNVLRKEWGWDGIVITDWMSNGPMSYVDAMVGGTNSFDGNGTAANYAKYKDNAVIAQALRESARVIIYNVVRTNAMNGTTLSSKVIPHTPWWQKALVAEQATVGSITGVCVIMFALSFVIKGKKKPSDDGGEVPTKRIREKKPKGPKKPLNKKALIIGGSIGIVAILAAGIATPIALNSKNKKHNEGGNDDKTSEVTSNSNSSKPSSANPLDSIPEDTGSLKDNIFEFEDGEFEGISANASATYGHACTAKSFFTDLSLSGGISLRNVTSNSSINTVTYKFKSDKSYKVKMLISVASKYESNAWPESSLEESIIIENNKTNIDLSGIIIPSSSSDKKVGGNNYSNMNLIEVPFVIFSGDNELVFTTTNAYKNIDYFNIRTSAKIEGYTPSKWGDPDKIFTITKEPTLTSTGTIAVGCDKDGCSNGTTNFTLPKLTSSYYNKEEKETETIYSFTLLGKKFSYTVIKSSESVDPVAFTPAVGEIHNESKSYNMTNGNDFFKGSTWNDYSDAARSKELLINDKGELVFERNDDESYNTSSRINLFQVAAKGTGWSHLADKKANSDAATDFPYGTTWSYEMDIKATGAFTMLLHGTSKASADGLTYVTSGSNETAVQNGVYLDFGADGSITLRHRCAGNNVGQHPEYESINEVAAAAGSFALNETVKLRIDINRVNDSELTTVLYVNDVAVKLEGTFADTTCFELLENGGYDYKNVLLTNGYGQRFGISATGGTVTISSMNITSQAPAAEEVPETPAE